MKNSKEVDDKTSFSKTLQNPYKVLLISKIIDSNEF